MEYALLLGLIGLIGGAAVASSNRKSVQETNQANKEINEENLAFQREQFDYQKQLNQLQMEREDTAFSRLASDAQKNGINPMALAGSSGASTSPLSSTSFGGVSANQIPNIQQNNIVGDAISNAVGVSNMIQMSDYYTAQRDLLQSQVDMQNLQNAITAFKAGVIKNPDGSFSFDSDKSASLEVRDLLASTERNERVNTFQKDTGTNDTTTKPTRSFIDVIDATNNNSTAQNLRERLLTWLQDNKDKDRSWKPSDYFEEGPIENNQRKIQKGLSDIYSNGVSQIQDFLKFAQSKKALKNLKKNQARYYNEMIRNNYLNAN